MLNVSLSNLSYFSISSFKTLIIKDAEGDDHKERLKSFNKIFEIITALQYREQCLLMNEPLCNSAEGSQAMIPNPSVRCYIKTKAAIKSIQTPYRMPKAA